MTRPSSRQLRKDSSDETIPLTSPHHYHHGDRDIDDDHLELGLQDLDTFDFASSIPLRPLRASRAAAAVTKRPSSDTDVEDDTRSLLPHPSVTRSDHDADSPGDDNEHHNDQDNPHDTTSDRMVTVGTRQKRAYPVNAISNSRYTVWDFLPRTLFNEFKFFINLYFLLVALSQIIPALRIGYLSSYILPLSMVLLVTLGKEAYDDVIRRKRDREANSEPFTVLHFGPSMSSRRRFRKPKRSPSPNSFGFQEILKPSRDIKIGDIVKLGKNQRVPADMVILSARASEAAPLRSSLRVSQTLFDDPDQDTIQSNTNPTDEQESGELFIRTDQLDGETDWKLRMSTPLSQSLELHQFRRLHITAAKPNRQVNDFVGTLTAGFGRRSPSPSQDASASASFDTATTLTVDNTAWTNTVIASSSVVYGAVVYTGSQTKQAMSTTASRAKIGLLELEINNLTKILCVLTFSLSVLLVVLGNIDHHATRPWYITALRFLILFSTVIPISLRINLDTGKLVYARYIENDKEIPSTIVRTSTIPEELGRIEYLLTDKTGTLTQNEMDLKKIHVGTFSYANEAMEEVRSYVNSAFGRSSLVTPSSANLDAIAPATRRRRQVDTREIDLVLALAICHNVTPTYDEDTSAPLSPISSSSLSSDSPVQGPKTSYQASSPDEIAIVKWTESVGLKLSHRDRTSMVLQSTKTNQPVVRVKILHVFPFTSESKRMGIVVKFIQDNGDDGPESTDQSEIWFYQKGADTVMAKIVQNNDWLEEETENMAREGLRTLAVGRKRLMPIDYREFNRQYHQASLALHGRDAAMADVVKSHLETDLELLGLTGVEDKLQKDVKQTLEKLRNAGIKIWMLTGDKVETARCVAVNSRLLSREQVVHTVTKLARRRDAVAKALQTLGKDTSAALLIDGESLGVLLQAQHAQAFIAAAARLPVVIACRVSPMQKAELATLVKDYSGKRICCIGDGGNDVSMIQAADVGVGIDGKEGKQASLAADFSIQQFHYLAKLLLWHGRNSYKRSAKLAQFVIHRGVIMSVCQVMFSIASKFGPNALYRDWLMVGYATVYTFFPVFSLVLDRDIDEERCRQYPELYHELTSGEALSYRTFFAWLGVSVYQGCMIQGLSQLLIPQSLVVNFLRMVGLSYVSLVLNELIMVAVEVTRWHVMMVVSIVCTLAVFVATLPFLDAYMDTEFLITLGFAWRICVVLALSLGPIYATKLISGKISPPTYSKVMDV